MKHLTRKEVEATTNQLLAEHIAEFVRYSRHEFPYTDKTEFPFDEQTVFAWIEEASRRLLVKENRRIKDNYNFD